MARLFVAVWPDEEVRRTLARLPRPVEPGVRWVPPEQWHVTLRFLGEAREDEVRAALDAATAALPAAPVARYGPAVSRLGRAVLCVPVRGLDVLAAGIVGATEHLGVPPDPRPFAGHLTVARLRHRGSCRLAGHRLVAQHEVRSLSLVASTLGAHGPSYRTVASWELRSPA